MNSKKVPRLLRWKTRNAAFCIYEGRRYYFGKWNAPGTREKYCAFVQKITSGKLPEVTCGSEDCTIAELALAFFDARQAYYVKNGQQTRQLERFKVACEFPLRFFPDLPVRLFGPRKLLECRAAMEASGRFSRTYINTLCSCFRQVVKFGVSIELVQPDVLVALQSVPPLKKGRSSARENTPIKPVSASDVEATLAQLSPVVAAMVRLQRLTGMRPGEVCGMRAGDLSEEGAGFVYTLRSDKTDWRRSAAQKKRIPIGPRAWRVLFPYLAGKEPDDYVFTPAEALAAQREARRDARKTPETKQTRDRDAKRKPRTVAPCYNRNSYRQAIVRAAKRAGVPAWSPNRLRHLFATEIREKYGLEAAQACLGHARADVTQIYAERDYRKAEEIAQKEG